MKRFFTLEYWTDEGWFVGKLKEIPGVFSQGATLDELKENIADAYRMMLASEPAPKHAKARTLEVGVEVCREMSSCVRSPAGDATCIAMVPATTSMPIRETAGRLLFRGIPKSETRWPN